MQSKTGDAAEAGLNGSIGEPLQLHFAGHFFIAAASLGCWAEQACGKDETWNGS